MKKIVVISILLFTAFACKKENDIHENLPELQGIWSGKWGDFFDEQVYNYSFELKPNHVAIINDSYATYEGEWHIDEYTFVASYNVSGEVLQLKAPISASKLEGTWKNITSNTYNGTFYMIKL